MAELLDQMTLDRDLAHLHGWRRFDRSLRAVFRTPDFSTGTGLVVEISAVAEELNHHPDVDLRYSSVTVEVTTHDAGGITALDTMLARRVSALAAVAGASVVDEYPQRVEIAIDTLDAATIRPFWAAVFDAELIEMPDGAVDLDPRRGGPRVWFQTMDEPRPGRSRLHLDVYVPREEARARVEAAVAAGGTLLTEEYAPSWWVLADAEGNEVCICTPDE